MLNQADLIQLNCEQMIIQAGIAEASQAAAQPGRYPQLNSFDRIRLRAADGIAALAFRRCLAQREVPHQLIPSPNFNQTNGYDPALGGRRCLPVAQLVCRRSLIRSLNQNPGAVLGGKVFLPEQADWDAYGGEDLMVFAFISALVTRSREATKRALVAGQPLHLLYRMPPAWSLPEQWAPLEILVLKTDLSRPTTLTLHGQDGHQRYLTQQVRLEGHKRTEVSTGLFSVGALEVDHLPMGPLGLHNPTSGETLLAAPYQWGNVWLYALRIVLAGYIRRGDFYRLAERANLAEALVANPCLKDESLLSLPVSALKSLPGLFQKAEAWASQN
jgi:hypothetical protein